MKTHWRNLSNQPHLGCWDLEEDGQFKTATLTIEKIYQAELVGQMGKQQKSFIKFHELQKSMVCNATNFKRLQRLFGTFDFTQYIDKKIILQVENVDSPEGKVDALRVSTRAPQTKTATTQKKTLTDVRLEEAIKAINDETNVMTKEQFLSLYQLNESQTLKLDASC